MGSIGRIRNAFSYHEKSTSGVGSGRLARAHRPHLSKFGKTRCRFFPLGAAGRIGACGTGAVCVWNWTMSGIFIELDARRCMPSPRKRFSRCRWIVHPVHRPLPRLRRNPNVTLHPAGRHRFTREASPEPHPASLRVGIPVAGDCHGRRRRYVVEEATVRTADYHRAVGRLCRVGFPRRAQK